MHIQRAVDIKRDLLVRFPSARSAAQRLRTPDEMDVGPAALKTPERLEGRIHDIQTTCATVRYRAEGQRRAKQHRSRHNGGKTVRVGEVRLRTIVRRSALSRTRIENLAPDVVPAHVKIRIRIETE